MTMVQIPLRDRVVERVELVAPLPPRTRPLGEVDTIARGNTAHRHWDPEAGVEYLHTNAYVCTASYERPRTEWADPDAERARMNSLVAGLESGEPG